jgi:hypothetical protein
VDLVPNDQPDGVADRTSELPLPTEGVAGAPIPASPPVIPAAGPPLHPAIRVATQSHLAMRIDFPLKVDV